MSRHRRAAAPRSWWQVIIPVFTLGALLATGVTAAVMTHSGNAQANPAPSASPGVTQVTIPPPARPTPHPSPSQTYYRVARGDSWWSIAARFCHNGGDMAVLASRNHASLYGALPLGRTIVITCTLDGRIRLLRKHSEHIVVSTLNTRLRKQCGRKPGTGRFPGWRKDTHGNIRDFTKLNWQD